MPVEDVEPVYAEIGTLLMCHRHERDLSQGDVGDLIGLTRASIANIEAGRQRLMLHTVVAIAALLGMEPGTLVDRAMARVRARNGKH
jgi:DNA-binding XRE family transcriptional regulator